MQSTVTSSVKLLTAINYKRMSEPFMHFALIMRPITVAHSIPPEFQSIFGVAMETRDMLSPTTALCVLSNTRKLTQ